MLKLIFDPIPHAGEPFIVHGPRSVAIPTTSPNRLVELAAKRYLRPMPNDAPGKATFAFDPFDPIRSERRMLDTFMKAADIFDAKHSKSKAAAQRQLRKEGVITKSGRLTKRFGG